MGFISHDRRRLPFGYCPKGKVRVDALVGILCAGHTGRARWRPPASDSQEQALKYGYFLAATSAFGMMGLLPLDASAGACVKGVYRAGCAGPSGAVVVKKPPPPKVACVNGVYRAGCAGPNGAAVVRK